MNPVKKFKSAEISRSVVEISRNKAARFSEKKRVHAAVVMKKNPLSIAALFLISAGLGAPTVAQSAGLKQLRNTKTKDPETERMLRLGSGKWPFSGKNGAQRSRMAAGFASMS